MIQSLRESKQKKAQKSRRQVLKQETDQTYPEAV
jgi:hypothetical protein